MVMDTDLMEEDMDLDTAPSASLGTIWSSKTILGCRRCCAGFSSASTMPSLLRAMVKPGLTCSAANGRSLSFWILSFPESPGASFARRSRIYPVKTPVIVLSAISEVVDKVLLLELGADDYVTKPYSPRELTARVQAAIRDGGKPAVSTSFRFADCEIDFKSMTARRDGVCAGPDRS